jgi:hypothetical protein
MKPQVNAALLLSLLTFGACEAVTGLREGDGACPQTYEFSNHGCAEVSGRVLGTGGQPLAGITVYPAVPEDGHGYNTPHSITRADGAFHLRMTRYVQRHPVTAPDTFSVYVVARATPIPVEGGGPPVFPARDSVLVQLELAPVGKVPTPAEVEIRLAYP